MTPSRRGRDDDDNEDDDDDRPARRPAARKGPSQDRVTLLEGRPARDWLKTFGVGSDDEDEDADADEDERPARRGRSSPSARSTGRRAYFLRS